MRCEAGKICVLWYKVARCADCDVVQCPQRGVALRGGGVAIQSIGNQWLVWCGVVWCGVVWCGVVWCAEGAVTRRQWPGCLPMGTGKREGCVCSARAVCRCVVIGGKGGSRGNLVVTLLALGVVWCGVVWCGVVWCGVVWCGVVWCGVVWCGVVWCGVVGWGVVWWDGVGWGGMGWGAVVGGW